MDLPKNFRIDHDAVVDRNSYCLSLLRDERNLLIVAMVLLPDQGNKLSTASHETRRYLSSKDDIRVEKPPGGQSF